MSFVEYKTAGCKSQVRTLLRRRLAIRDKKRYHLAKIVHHKNKIEEIDKTTLPEIEKELENYLTKARTQV